MEAIQDIWNYLEEVPDPEIPVISVVDLGVVRDIQLLDDGGLIVTITPTYSGCPAMNEIQMGIRLKLLEYGYRHVQIQEQLSPAWTTDWLSESGREKMQAYGIAPPIAAVGPEADLGRHPRGLFQEERGVHCPQCGSQETKVVSQFGSTACKALYQCESCLEPFDYFKCHPQ